MFLLQFSLKETDTLIKSPSWVSYINQSTVLNVPTTKIDTTFESGWKYVPENFEGKIVDDKNQFVIINYPANPTGQTYTHDQLKGLAKVFDRDNTIVLADEIY